VSTELDSQIELYDHDIQVINAVVRELNLAAQKVTTVEGWRNEIVGRFHEKGFNVTVTLRQVEGVEYSDGTVDTVDGPIYTTIIVQSRTEAVAEFDHDKQRAEVQADILGRRGGDDRSKVSVAMPGAATKRASGLWVPADK
jgi:hypothetical protein